MRRASPLFCSVGVHISGRTQSRKLKFNMQIYLTHINNIFEYCQASVLLDNVDVLYLEDGNLCIQVLKNNTATIFFSQETFSSSKLWTSAIPSWF